MTVRNLSPATQQSYVYAVAKFSRFFGRVMVTFIPLAAYEELGTVRPGAAA